MQLLPLEPSIPHYTFSTVISDNTYLFEVRWNARDAAWYMDVAEQDGAPIVTGVKVVLGANLARRANHKLFTLGAFVAMDTSRTGVDATLDDLGTRVQVVYMTNFEILATITRYT